MKEKFWGYLPLKETEFKNIWVNSKIVLDTNILLNLYRYTESTQKEVIRILDERNERFVIPELVIKEFFANRDGVIENHHNIREKVIENLKISDMKSSIDKHRHINLNNHKLKEIIEEFEKNINNELSKCRTDSFYEKDTILERISDWFNDRVMDPLTNKELEEIFKEGEVRYTNKIPPGYKDDSKSESNSKYNDLVIWKQIMKYAKDNESNIIFISDDLKEDWIKTIGGKKIGPREELLNEFYRYTNGQKIYIYSTNGFLNAYSKFSKNREIGKDTISEVENLENSYITNKKMNSFSARYFEFVDDDYKKYPSKTLNKKLALNKYEEGITNEDIDNENIMRKFIEFNKELTEVKEDAYNNYNFFDSDINLDRLRFLSRKLRILNLQIRKSQLTEKIRKKLLVLINEYQKEIYELEDNFIPF
ncbi:PIN domain-containing protein [Gudongella sp. DL1XJH-153]|uniref:PIN domain-containing protein n=1 Tax=Gudongella sp. DL1XJH-153 TaxID=3409804 RepID=UPI003BB51D75